MRADHADEGQSDDAVSRDRHRLEDDGHHAAGDQHDVDQPPAPGHAGREPEAGPAAVTAR
jgi:hypothetical protein